MAGCPNKCEGLFQLSDVNPNDKVKKYSDSQCMSFYSNNIGRLTVQSQGGVMGGFYQSKSKLLSNDIKSPEAAATTTPYDPFGSQEYKVRYFQHSAHNFMSRRTAQLNATNELEESKTSELQVLHNNHSSDNNRQGA